MGSKDKSFEEVTQNVFEAILASPKQSRRVLLKTIIKQFGYKRSSKDLLDRITSQFTAAGILVTPSLSEVGRGDWVTLSVVKPSLPIGNFADSSLNSGPVIDTDEDPWFTSVAAKSFISEKEVEIRFVIPLLERLGYSETDRSDGYPVEITIGVKKTRTEADFVLFDGMNRVKDNALMVVEAKKVGKNVTDHAAQARSYAMFLGTPYYMITNGDDLKVFHYRSPIQTDIEIFSGSRANLKAMFGELHKLVNKEAIVGYKKRLVEGLLFN